MKKCNYENAEQIIKEATKLIKYIEEFELDNVRYEATLGYNSFNVSINNMRDYYRIAISKEGIAIIDEYKYNIENNTLEFSKTYEY